MRCDVMKVMLVGACLLMACRVRREESAPRPSPTHLARVSSAASLAATSPKTEPPARAAAPIPSTLPTTASSVAELELPVDVPSGALVLIIGAVPSSTDSLEGARSAARFATRALLSGKSARDATVAGLAALEQDRSFPAGLGSPLRQNGNHFECESALMLESGEFAAVAGLMDVDAPVRVVDRLLTWPGTVLLGAGAQALAEEIGISRAPLGTGEGRTQRDSPQGTETVNHPDRVSPQPVEGGTDDGGANLALSSDSGEAASAASDAGSPSDAGFQPSLEPSSAESPQRPFAESPQRPHAESPQRPHAESPQYPTTVGVLVRTGDGHFAGGVSSGGRESSRLGEMGSVPVMGAALFAGPEGVIVISSTARGMSKGLLAKEAYERLEQMRIPKLVARWAIRTNSDLATVGVVSRMGSAVESNYEATWAENGPDGERVAKVDPVRLPNATRDTSWPSSAPAAVVRLSTPSSPTSTSAPPLASSSARPSSRREGSAPARASSGSNDGRPPTDAPAIPPVPSSPKSDREATP